MSVDIWVIGTLNQILKDVLILLLNFRKNKVLSSKSPFLIIGSFHKFNFDRKVLYGNVALSIIVRSTKNRYSGLLKKVLVFQKVSLTVDPLNRGLFRKSKVLFFTGT